MFCVKFFSLPFLSIRHRNFNYFKFRFCFRVPLKLIIAFIVCPFFCIAKLLPQLSASSVRIVCRLSSHIWGLISLYSSTLISLYLTKLSSLLKPIRFWKLPFAISIWFSSFSVVCYKTSKTNLCIYLIRSSLIRRLYLRQSIWITITHSILQLVYSHVFSLALLQRHFCVCHLEFELDHVCMFSKKLISFFNI